MPRVKPEGGAAKKPATKRSVKKTATKIAAPEASDTAARAKPAVKPAVKPARKTAAPKTATRKKPLEIAEEQATVVASKFANVESSSSKPIVRPTLPGTYGESHLLLLVRDPQTLFAAWDVSPSAIENVRAKVGARALAVSNMTLRLFREGGIVTVFHLTKKARSRYIKIDGSSPAFVAEIGFTTPTGRFELIARSAPCFVPLGVNTRLEGPMTSVRRAIVGYREARALAKRGVLAAGAPPSRARARRAASLTGSPNPSVSTPQPRVLGGASDLYRR